MKKEIITRTFSIKDITIEEAVNEFFDFGDWCPNDWDYTIESIYLYVENDFIEISEKEKELLKIEIEKEFDKRVNEIRKEEILDLILQNGNK